MTTPIAPPEVTFALADLAQRDEQLTLQLRPWQAWQLVLVCQALWRDPSNPPVIPPALEQVGRAAQAVLAEACPAAGPILEAGWIRPEA